MKGKVALFLLNVIWWSPSNADPGHDHDPPKIPDRFSVRAEMIDSARKEIYSFTDTIDIEANFARRDFVPTEAKFFRRFRQFGERPLVVIDDFATGHEFVIDRWRGNCSVMDISSQEKYDFSDKHDPFGMRRALPFLISPDFKYVKSGTLRGIPVDVFRRKVNGTIMVKFFILAQDWNELSDQFRQKTFSVPVAIDYRRYDKQTGKFVFRRTNLYDFSTDHTELALFRMEHCFNRNLSRRVEIKLKGKPAGDHLTGFDVRYAIVKNLSATMGVSFTRISHLHLGVSRGEGPPSVIFNLYEPIRAASYLPKPAVQTSVDDAIERLQSIVEKGFSIVVPGYSGSVTLEAEEVSVTWTLWDSVDDTVSPTPQPLTRQAEGSQADYCCIIGADCCNKTSVDDLAQAPGAGTYNEFPDENYCCIIGADCCNKTSVDDLAQAPGAGTYNEFPDENYCCIIGADCCNKTSVDDLAQAPGAGTYNEFPDKSPDY